MIYNGPITDPRHRYYLPPPEFNYNQISEGKERYVKFRAQPVNLSRTNHGGPNLSNSHIYTKNGLLRRNQVGWDGVKLTQYVTGQLSQNFIQNQRILQKFRKDAQENKRIKKYAHVFSSQNHQHEQTPKPQIYLPEISPVSHKQYNIETSINPKLNPEQMLIEQEIKHYRNVGVNTNKLYQKVQLEKYRRLKLKYQELKRKYSKQKDLNFIQKRELINQLHQRQREVKMRQQQLFSFSKQKEKLNQIQSQLININVKLQTSQQILSSHLHSKIKSKDKELEKEKEKEKESQFQYSGWRFKKREARKKQLRLNTQPLNQTLNHELNEMASFENIEIPENPLDLLENKNKSQQKSPRVIYSNRSEKKNEIKSLLKYINR